MCLFGDRIINTDLSTIKHHSVTFIACFGSIFCRFEVNKCKALAMTSLSVHDKIDMVKFPITIEFIFKGGLIS